MSGKLDGLFRPRAVAVIGATNNPFAIGNIVVRNLYDHGFKGLMDEPALFNRALTQAEIQGLYLNGLKGFGACGPGD